jgi:hypothetical protein
MPKTIHVTSPYTLNLGDGRVVSVAAGIQTLDDEIADHWYTKAHSAQAGLTGVEYAAHLRGQADAQYVRAKEAMALYLAYEQQAADAAKSAGIEDDKPSTETFGPMPTDVPPPAEPVELLAPVDPTTLQGEAMPRGTERPPNAQGDPLPKSDAEATTERQTRHRSST